MHENYENRAQTAELSGSAAQAVAQVAAAFAARKSTTVDEIVDLTMRLTSIFAGSGAVPAPPAKSGVARSTLAASVGITGPAVPIKNAVSKDKVFCLCCGRGFTMLKRHLKAEHQLSEEEYRALFTLPDNMPLVAPDYSARKAAYAKRVGLGKYTREQTDQKTIATG